MSYIASPQRRQAVPPPAGLRRRIETAINRLIAALDAIDAPDEDLEDGDDREDDRADMEPSLAATLDLDQRVAWTHSAFGSIDGEATGTEDDIDAGLDVEGWKARRPAADGAGAQLRTILARRNASHAGVAR